MWCQFSLHHSLTHTLLSNLHDQSNLIPLCKICHTAFDDDEWTFFPEDMTDWIKELQINESAKMEYNVRRDIKFRRVLLSPFPSDAYNDQDYRSAFVNEPIKQWKGEAGVLIIRNFSTSGLVATDASVANILASFKALHQAWMDITIKCALEDCDLCNHLKSLEKANEDTLESDDEDENENGDEDDEKDQNEAGDIPESPNSNNKGKENENDDKEDRKRKRASTQGQSQARNYEFVTRPIKRLIYGRKSLSKEMKAKIQKREDEREPDWMLTKPYDESIPYSHRHGYTYRNSTSASAMATWQAYREPIFGK